MNLIQVLTIIKEAGIKVSPFTNYDKVTEAEYAENGISFKCHEAEWPIHAINFTGSGNLNISFEQAGVMTEPDGTAHECKQYRQIAVVRDGELYQQFLQLTKDKAEQARLVEAGVKVKNNIVNLGEYPLTDKTTVDVDEIFSEKVKDFVGSLHKVSVNKFPKMTPDEYRLYLLGLSPDGVYSKKATAVHYQKDDSVKVAIKGLSSKTTKAAQELKTATAGITVTKSKLNELLYTARVLKVHADRASTCTFAGRSFTGTVKV